MRVQLRVRRLVPAEPACALMKFWQKLGQEFGKREEIPPHDIQRTPLFYSNEKPARSCSVRYSQRKVRLIDIIAEYRSHYSIQDSRSGKKKTFFSSTRHSIFHLISYNSASTLRRICERSFFLEPLARVCIWYLSRLRQLFLRS